MPSWTARRGIIAAAAAFAGANVASAQPQDWPTTPIRFIGLFPPGGGTDILSRIVCARLAELTGQQFIVENRSGSGGNVGSQAIARATPDGSVIGLASVAPLSIAPSLYATLPFDVTRDFTYVAPLWKLPNLLIVNRDVPAHSVPELIALLRQHPDRYAYASAGSGTTLHLSGEMLKVMAGVRMEHIPYRGGAPAHVDLLAGRVHMIFDNIPQGLAATRDGRVRALAVTSAQRSPDLPDIPTMAEYLPGFEITSWGGIMGPAGLPARVVQRLSALTRQALETPDLIAKFRDSGATPWWTTPDDFAAFRAQDEARFAPLIRASGARVD